jgi:hypothetical protein
MERQLPGPIPPAEFVRTIKVLEDFVGSAWLAAQPPGASPLTEVWNRYDYLSSLELFTVADSYHQMAPRTEAEWLAQYKAALRSHNAKDIVSQTYELVSAAMFSYAHQVKLCPPSHKGYDFTVSDGGKTVRVSCKKLGPSDGERKFRESAQSLYEHVRATAARLGSPSFQAVLHLADPDDKLKLTLGELQSGVTNRLAAFRGGLPVRHRIGGWRLTIAPLLYGLGDLAVDREYLSHTFIYVAPYAQDEQRRFSDRFHEAARKLKVHGPPVDGDNVNMVMIGLPPAVSLSTAAEWLNRKFSREYSSVSAALLNRAIIVSDEGLHSASLHQEIALVTNPNAKVGWYEFVPRGFTYSLKVPIGKVTEAESYLALNLLDEVIPLKDKYVFQRGQVNLQTPMGKEMNIAVYGSSGVQYNFIVRDPDGGAAAVAAPTPPDNSLLLL